jgi:hypothetical protein
MYQFKREPLTQDEATRLANACQSHPENSHSAPFFGERTPFLRPAKARRRQAR